MLLTQRQAATLLGERVGVARRAATRLLEAGLAGTPQRTPACLLYEREAVERLTTRPFVGRRETLPPECGGGVLVARTTATSDPVEAVSGPARFSIITEALIRLLPPPGQGWYPLVVVMNHFVVAGAEITAVERAPDDHPLVRRAESWPGNNHFSLLRTRPAGPWFAEAFEERMLFTASGNPYLLWERPLPPATPRTNPPDAIC